uniref:Uncharacterized protein n=1 Tax=Falco tinnunculus TaxID=100819 RepID=A0A8C4VDN6_FALTI
GSRGRAWVFREGLRVPGGPASTEGRAFRPLRGSCSPLAAASPGPGLPPRSGAGPGAGAGASCSRPRPRSLPGPPRPGPGAGGDGRAAAPRPGGAQPAAPAGPLRPEAGAAAGAAGRRQEHPGQARENRYEVIFQEPDTPWKFNVQELTRRNIHHVPRQKIQQMKEQYEHNVTFHSVLWSEKPSRDERSSSGPNAAYGTGAHSNPPAAFSNRRPRGAHTNTTPFH